MHQSGVLQKYAYIFECQNCEGAEIGFASKLSDSASNPESTYMLTPSVVKTSYPGYVPAENSHDSQLKDGSVVIVALNLNEGMLSFYIDGA